MVLLFPIVGVGQAVSNPFKRKGKVLVSKIAAKSDVKNSILNSVDLIGGFSKIIEEGDNVLIKPNYNSADSPPASTSPDFLAALIELIYAHGAEEVVVGESSMQTLSTRRVMAKTGTLEAVKSTGAEFAFFDEEAWTKIDVGGEYLKSVRLAERALEARKVIYCCCMKTHFRADFSLSLKLGFGFTKGSERMGFHISHLKEKLVDLNLVLHPSLIIMDGRRCFITGGPFNGEVREPSVILSSGDRVALDVEAIKIIKSYDGSKLTEDPWTYAQIRRAVRLGLGVKDPGDYEIV